MSSQKLIYHCCSNSISQNGGGVKTYIKNLFSYKTADMSDNVINSLENIDQSQFKLLHLHGGGRDFKLLEEVRRECPVVYTLHNHDPYCPSGTKYLSNNQVCCSRNMSYLPCIWGHLIDGCGSRRPGQMITNIRHSYQQIRNLKLLKIPVLATSNYMSQQIIKNGLSTEQITVLPLGISVPRNAFKPLTWDVHQNQKILYVGRIVPYKGLDWLLKALAQTEFPIHLDIAGEGWARPQMEKLANNLGIAKRITWHGWCSTEKLDVLYQQCFALIFPSVWSEPAGLVTLEAYARHRPVIASAVGGIPEYVADRKTGILVPANNIKKLASAIIELAQNYQKARRMSEEANIWFMKEFTIGIHIQRLQKIYEQYIT
ncbi:MAG: glycosyltransferase family 4 protein [Hyellaceae cyanobacterium CSU_1_1]|nr:glycosyltransferase family 4 protein [Hyellaceae cyanobacterium CSU_1_1]